MILHPANSVEIGTVTNYELFQQTKLDELKGDEATETWEEGKQLKFEINKYLFKKKKP